MIFPVRFLFCAVMAAVAPSLPAADALVLEKIAFQFDEHGQAGAIGVIKNTSRALIAVPTLEVTYVTKGKPAEVQRCQLGLSISLNAGESRPFHTGRFSAPHVLSSDGKAVADPVLEIKSARIHPFSMVAASADWKVRLEGRDRVSFDKPTLSSDGSMWHRVQGFLLAPKGSKIRLAEFTAAFYDAKGELVDVQSFRVRAPEGKCIETFPHPCDASVPVGAVKIAPASIKCLCDSIVWCE